MENTLHELAQAVVDAANAAKAGGSFAISGIELRYVFSRSKSDYVLSQLGGLRCEGKTPEEALLKLAKAFCTASPR